MPETTVIVVGGPTASGKSALALDLAEEFNGTVINADSMQIYRELSVLTARPTATDEARAPHRLYGALSGSERCSAARWQAMALEEIRTAKGSGRVPIVVGGTGLYLRALMEGLADIPPVPAGIRASVRDLQADIGSPGLHGLLAERDPETAARLKRGDTQRLLRAMEVLEATGRSITAWQSDPLAGPPAGLRFLPIVVDPPREALYAACDGRFDRMIELGALDEVRALTALDLPSDLPVMKALGVPELSSYLLGKSDLPAAAASARQSTRRYAKRQGTWFRHQLAPVHGCHVISTQYSESLKPVICNIIRKMG